MFITKFNKIMIPAILMFACSSCLQFYSIKTLRSKTHYFENAVLDKETTWNGIVIINKSVIVPKGITLNILPGTLIKFVFADEDKDKIGDSKIIVKGKIIAEGTCDQPIIFTSNGKNKKPKDWYSIQIINSDGNIFKYCKVEYSFSGFEAERSQGLFSHNIFTNNIKGMMFAQCNFIIENSLFRNNTYGLWFCDNINDKSEEIASEIHFNTIKENQFGIFCKYDSPNTKITNNNIFSNERYNISFSLWVKKDVNAANNFWGEINENAITEKIFDQRRDKNLGKVLLDPYLLKAVYIPEN